MEPRTLRHEKKYKKTWKEIRQHLNGQKFNWKILSDCNDGMMPQMCEQLLKICYGFITFHTTAAVHVHEMFHIYIIKAWWTVNCMSFSAPHKFHSYVT